MAIPKGKQRITITVSDESVNKLSMYGEKMGMNRSALCAYLVGQGLMGLDKANSMIDMVSEGLVNDLKKTLADLSSGASGGGAE